MGINYFLEPATAYVRGICESQSGYDLPDGWLRKALNDLSPAEMSDVVQFGVDAGLRLHRFKKSMGLRRVHRVLGILTSIQPEEVLDVGSGRGAFLWPLLETFPHLNVTSIDQSEVRAEMLDAVHRGGLDRLKAHQMDATSMRFPGQSFDVVTFLEVLEHIPDPQLALNEAVRVARRFVIVSVPSKEDDNPEHIHLFSKNSLAALFNKAGVNQVNFEYVLNHMIAVANLGKAQS